jgi:hypothetical protein
MIYNLAKGYPDTDPAEKEKARDIVRKCLAESILDETEYASMLRSFFRDNPIDF